MSDDDKTQRTAEKVTILSYTILDTAIHLENITAALQTLQDHFTVIANGLNDLVSELPPEVQKKLKVEKPFENPKGKDGPIDYLRRLLENEEGGK